MQSYNTWKKVLRSELSFIREVTCRRSGGLISTSAVFSYLSKFNPCSTKLNLRYAAKNSV